MYTGTFLRYYYYINKYIVAHQWLKSSNKSKLIFSGNIIHLKPISIKAQLDFDRENKIQLSSLLRRCKIKKECGKYLRHAMFLL